MFAVCLIVKDEPIHYIEEWLDWHREAGVDRFFIYDQGGWLISGKDIVVRPFPGPRMQLPAYNHCLRDCDKADFLAFIDLDEFMMGPVKERLESVENALALNWKIYGTSGIRWNTTGKQMGVFRDYIPAVKSLNKHLSQNVKVIVRPNKTVRMDVHFGKYESGGTQEAFDGTRFIDQLHGIDTYSGAWLNHYFTRSESDWKKKVERGKISGRYERRLEGMFVIDHGCVESDGPIAPKRENLPRVARARYGVERRFRDVTEELRWILEQGWIEIQPGGYNSILGDPAPNETKSLQIAFERQGKVVGELNVTENEALFLP